MCWDIISRTIHSPVTGPLWIPIRMVRSAVSGPNKTSNRFVKTFVRFMHSLAKRHIATAWSALGSGNPVAATSVMQYYTWEYKLMQDALTYSNLRQSRPWTHPVVWQWYRTHDTKFPTKWILGMVLELKFVNKEQELGFCAHKYTKRTRTPSRKTSNIGEQNGRFWK